VPYGQIVARDRASVARLRSPSRASSATPSSSSCSSASCCRRSLPADVACASGRRGSELYSVALLLDRAGGLERSFLLGSDLLEENLAVAKAGVSRDFAAGDRLRSYLRWERRDIARDGPPAGSWRLILCRNVAIYFAPDAKRDLHAALARALAPSGVLLLGRSERVADPAAVGLRRVARNAYAKEAVA
jgi:chemotaxis protein methyltransferase CheR